MIVLDEAAYQALPLPPGRALPALAAGDDAVVRLVNGDTWTVVCVGAGNYQMMSLTEFAEGQSRARAERAERERAYEEKHRAEIEQVVRRMLDQEDPVAALVALVLHLEEHEGYLDTYGLL